MVFKGMQICNGLSTRLVGKVNLNEMFLDWERVFDGLCGIGIL